MKAYVIVTGIVFSLLTLVHLWRIVMEPHLATEPWYLAITVVAATISVWSWRVVRRSPRP